MLSVGSLKKILEGLPDDTWVCMPYEGEGSACMDHATHYGKYKILYLSYGWPRDGYEEGAVRFDTSTGERMK